MVWYVITSIVLVLYFELLGQFISIKLNLKDYVLTFAFGFLAFISITYVVTSFFTGIGFLSWPIFLLYTLLLIIGFILIYINFKQIIKSVNIRCILITMLFTFIICLYSYRTTLGNIYGFDTEFYAGMVSTNSISKHFNEISPSYGVGFKQTLYQYSFQTYYYFASYIVKVLRFLLLPLGVSINNLSSFIWIFQILSIYLMCSLILNTMNIKTKSKKLFNIFVIITLILFYGRYYSNNVFGFFGNTFKTFSYGYTSLLLFNYKNIDRKTFKIVFSMCLLASCSFSSSSLFISIFVIFGYMYAFVEEDSTIFRYIALTIFVPLVNLITYITGVPTTALIVSFAVCCLLYFMNNILERAFRRKTFRNIILLMLFITMAVLSYKTTKNIFDFSGFINHLGTRADMTFNYFDIFGLNQHNIFCLLTDLSLLFYIIKYRKEKLSIICWVLIIVILNPLCCSYINSINPVYYRTYDIFINPCTFIVFTYYMFEQIKSKVVYDFLLITISMFFVFRSNILKPLFYHESFIPSNDYNGELRMNNDEYDAIRFIKEDSEYRGIKEPYILNNNLLTQAVIPNGKYVFSRNSKPWHIWGADLELYYIFFPVNKLSEEERPGVPKYEKLGDFLNESTIDYLVVDKELEFYDIDDEQYEYLFYKVQEFEYKNIYENDSYIVLVY